MTDAENHEYWQSLIPEFLARRLPADQDTALRRHLAECPECGDTLADAKDLVAGLIALGEDTLKSHPDADELIHYARNKSEINPSRVAALEHHLLFCQSCSAAVDSTRDVLDELHVDSAFPAQSRPRGTHQAWGSRLTWFWRPGVAYAIAGICLLILAYSTLDNQHGPMQSTIRLNSGSATWLAPPTRDAFDLPTVKRVIDNDDVHLVIDIGQSFAGPYNFQLVDSAGATVISAESRAADSTDLLSVSINGRELHDGSYRLRLTYDKNHGMPHEISYGFRLTTVPNQRD